MNIHIRIQIRSISGAPAPANHTTSGKIVFIWLNQLIKIK